jgi:hypothetical protein
MRDDGCGNFGMRDDECGNIGMRDDGVRELRNEG